MSSVFSKSGGSLHVSCTLAEILSTSGSATWKLKRSPLRWIWMVFFTQLGSRMWQQTSIWGCPSNGHPHSHPTPRKPFHIHRLHKASRLPLQPSISAVLWVKCLGNSNTQKIQHCRPLGRISSDLNLRTNWKTNKQITSKTFPKWTWALCQQLLLFSC